MNIHYISDDTGKTTGVFIPISDWNEMKSKYEELEDKVPNWQIQESRKRIKEFEKNPEELMNFKLALDEIRKRFS